MNGIEVIDTGILARPVSDAMQYHIVSAVPEMTVRELSRLLAANTISGAPVVDSTGKVVGVVSATDVVHLAAREAEMPAGQVDWNPVLPASASDEAADDDAWPAEAGFTGFDEAYGETGFDAVRVGDIMTPVAFSVRPNDTLATAIGLMRRGRIHRLLVMDGNFLQGIITPFDVFELIDRG